MDIVEVRVTEKRQNTGPCGRFAIQEPVERVRVRSGSMMAKISLCLGVLLIALVLELGGVAADRQQQVFASDKGQAQPTPEEALGALYYVEGERQDAPLTAVERVKWAPPVRSDEVTLLREDSVVGFSALEGDVCCCCAGQVFAVGEDEDWGKFVRVRSAGDIDVVYYGLEEVLVKSGQDVTAGARLGTVPLGRRVYLSVSEKGAPQDPRAYVNLTVEKRA